MKSKKEEVNLKDEQKQHKTQGRGRGGGERGQRGKGESNRDRERANCSSPPLAAPAVLQPARQAVLNLSQQDLNWGPSL